MNILSLNFYPELQCYFPQILKEFIPQKGEKYFGQGKFFIRVYSSFIHITGLSKQDVLRIFNSETQLNKHLQHFIGFIFSEMDNDCIGKSLTACYIFNKYSEKNSYSLQKIRTSFNYVTDDIKLCIQQYKSLEINTEILIFYKGWTAKDKEFHTHHLHLASIYHIYGKDFTTKLSKTIIDYIARQKKETASTFIKKIVPLFNIFTELFPTVESLNKAMSFEKQSASMSCVFNSYLIKKEIKGHCIRNFIKKDWTISVFYFVSAFTDNKEWFPESLHPIITPNYKIPRAAAVMSTGSGMSRKAKENLLTEIPLSFSDEEAFEEIFLRINKDIEHVKVHSKKMTEQTMAIHERNKVLRQKGIVKAHSGQIVYSNRDEYVRVGPAYLQNTIVTFEHYLYNYKGGDFTGFLGYTSDTKTLATELNIPTQQLLYPFLLLLVFEHPEITPAFLTKWELYGKNDQLVGYQKSNDSYVIVSIKDRKGAANAQQTITLNDTSKYLCDCLVALTSRERGYLKKQGNSDWRYMLLISSSVNSNPMRLKRICYFKSQKFSLLHERFSKPSFCEDGSTILNLDETKDLVKNISLRNARSSRAIQIYLETKSVNAMSEALGHKQYRPELIDIYLPDVLWEYFTNRHIRIFQNAIVYEATKESPYLFNAVDFTPEELETFLDRHAFGNFSEQLLTMGNESNAPSIGKEFNIDEIDAAVITVSVPLLQVLIALVDVIENAQEEELFVESAKYWYEVASLLIQHISDSFCKEKARVVRVNNDVKDMFRAAMENPLDSEMLKENILCR
jgi:hypothetical protein